MGVISVSLPTDGSTADAADVNTPFTTIVNEFNGNIDNANIKSGAAIDPSKIAGGSATMFTAWQTYTPTWSGATNPAIGNGTMTARYSQIGKTVTMNLNILMGSTTTYGSGEWNWTLPVAPNTTQRYVTGSAWGIDTGVNYYAGSCKITTSSAKVNIYSSAAAGAGWGTAGPFTWGSGDELSLTITYEAA